MNLKLIIILITFVATSCSKKKEELSNISDIIISQTIDKITSENNIIDKNLLTKGMKQVASLWRKNDGSENDFIKFCSKNYIKDNKEKDLVFFKISKNMESLYGHFNEIGLKLKENLQLKNGSPVHDIDEMFGAYSVSSHLMNDFYTNKIAFFVALNFPKYKLKEKNKLGHSWSRKQWAFARLGDIFTSRVPSELLQKYATVESKSDIYISAYNIYMGQIINNGESLFPKDMVLLSHWNLRDEIKANYNKKEWGLKKQETIYSIMKNIISQDIPQEIINSEKYKWDPIKNKVFDKKNKEIPFTKETNLRYQQIINNFHALKALDQYFTEEKTYIKRKFSGEMEIAVEDCEKLFDTFLSSKELKKVGEIISKRLGRPLRPYDIWYDGFKSRSLLDENKLNSQTEKLFPNAKAMEKRLPILLEKLGWTKERAKYLTDKISVDPARGSGHAAGATMKGANAHLRTRIPTKGMNYKGYNIAVHEFGHNVEQTISLYDIDYYMLNGVPNTSFTEALAFIFQKRDLFLLDIKNTNKEKKLMDNLDIFWSTYEIMGVSMLDISIWKWLYMNPQANATELKIAAIDIAKNIWNKYYAKVFGSKDETILAIYSHMISYPLYLSAYSFGQIIEFQVDSFLKKNNFANEVDRIYKQGRLTPQEWMRQATGENLSVEPMIIAARKAIKEFK